MLRRVLLSAGLSAATLVVTSLWWGFPALGFPRADAAPLSYVAAPAESEQHSAQRARSLLPLPLPVVQPGELGAILDFTKPLKVVYVSPQGNDSGPGTEAAPYRTINKAASVAKPGTTVHVAPGTYNGSVEMKTSGAANARIVYISDTKWGAKIKGDGDGAAWHNTGEYVDIVGFDISGTNEDGILQEASFGRIAANNIYGFTHGTCLQTENNGYTLHDIDIISNVVHGCGENSLHHGIYVSYPNGRVSNNMAYGNTGYGIHCWHNCNKLTITNNLVFDNDEGGMVIGQGDNPNNGSVDADNFLVANNIAVNNGNAGIKESGATGPNNRYVNNNLFGNKDGGLNLNTGKATGTITTDPQFVSFKLDGTGDYRLKPTSPNINAGTNLGAPLKDMLGVPRPRGGGVDIGIFEL